MGKGIGPYKNKWREHLFKKQGGLCHWCKKPMSLRRRKNGDPARDFATFEHLVRCDEGGKMNATNVVLAHTKCNHAKNHQHQVLRNQLLRKQLIS